MFSLSEFFRSVFGPSRERWSPSDLPRNIQEDFEKFFGRTPDNDLNWQQPPANHEEGSIFYEHPGHGEYQNGVEFSEGEFFQEFEQMFQSFFRGFPFDVTPPVQGPSAIDAPHDMSSDIPPQESYSNQTESLRDRMLKEPESSPKAHNFPHEQEGSHSDGFSLFHPFSMFRDLLRIPFGGLRYSPEQQLDRDLDSEVEMGTQSLDDILSQRNKHQIKQHVPRLSWPSSSFSSVTIVYSNGVHVTEQRTTKRNSSGEEEMTVTRKIGNQTHTVTRKKDESGNEETQEDLVNIDSDGLAEFNEKWHHSKHRGRHPHSSDDSSQQQTPLSSIYESVLEQFFPKR